jgi:hypothetical protein
LQLQRQLRRAGFRHAAQFHFQGLTAAGGARIEAADVQLRALGVQRCRAGVVGGGFAGAASSAVAGEAARVVRKAVSRSKLEGSAWAWPPSQVALQA